MMLTILALLTFIGVMTWNWYRNDLRRLTRDYACKGAFDADLESCIIRFPLDEAGTEAVLGANREGLFMSSSIEALNKSRRWSFRYYAIRTPIFIPWRRIHIGEAKFPMHSHLRFSVPSNKASFFVPRETGRRLLEKAGRASLDR